MSGVFSAKHRTARTALSALFRDAEPDYRAIARTLRGHTLEALREIAFAEKTPLSDADLARWREAEEAISRHWSNAGPAPETVAAMAHTAMLMEVGASPKPGLVCPDHNGSHKDMDHALFVASADSLHPYLLECVTIGMDRHTDPAEAVFPLLREAGVRAEQAMFSATKGVNTHKGMIFSMGLATAGAGRAMGQGSPPWPETVAEQAGSLVRGIVARDLEPLRRQLPDRRLTAGEKLYLEHGIPGIRQEAENGFPSALETFRRLHYLYDENDLELALPHELLHLIATTDDTNIVWRGGIEGLAYARAAAVKALQKGGLKTPEGRENVCAMRDEFVRRNLSPGGSADLLAVASFFLLLQRHDSE